MESPMESQTSYSLAVVAVGAALVVLFAGACVILAVGHEVPQALWAAAAGLSGALVGILIPTGGTAAAADHVVDAASVTKAAATEAASGAVARITEDAPSEAAEKGANRALNTVKNVKVAAKVNELRNAITPVGMMIDEVIGIFTGHEQDANAKVDVAGTALADGQDQVVKLQDEVDAATAAHTVHQAAAEAARKARDNTAQIAAPEDPSGAATDAEQVAHEARTTKTAATEAAHLAAAEVTRGGTQTPGSQQAAQAALETVNDANVDAKVKEMSDAKLPAGKTIDEIVKIFTGHEQDAGACQAL
jgi:hypothetical protein